MGLILVLAWIGLGMIAFVRLMDYRGEHAHALIAFTVFIYFAVPMIVATLIP